jgi:hypothetical protein
MATSIDKSSIDKRQSEAMSGQASSAPATIMKMASSGVLAAGLLLGPAAWGQSPSYSDGRMPEPQLVPPIDLAQVPRDACLWANAIYSNGAMMVQSDLFTTYFQCERGNWIVISPSEAIFRRRTAVQPGRSNPTQP